MLAATWVKMSDSGRKLNKNTYNISSIKRVTRKRLEVSRCSRAKTTAKKCTKKVCCTCRVAFSLIRHFYFFTVLVALFEQTKNIIGGFAFSPG